MRRLTQLIGLLTIGWLSSGSATQEVRLAGDAASATIDIGVVVSDLQQSVDFYTQIIGFEEAPGFSVSDEFCRNAGLTDGHALDVRVLVLGKGPGAANLKLMTIPKAESKKSDNTFIHSQLGISYLTIRMNDISPVMKRLAAQGGKPVAKSPVSLPGASDDGPKLLVIRDPDGNLIELIGPKK